MLDIKKSFRAAIKNIVQGSLRKFQANWIEIVGGDIFYVVKNMVYGMPKHEASKLRFFASTDQNMAHIETNMVSKCQPVRGQPTALDCFFLCTKKKQNCETDSNFEQNYGKCQNCI